MRFSDDAASSRIVLRDGTVLTKCDQCRDTYADRDDEPPCDSCWVDLLPENIEAGRIFQLVRFQVISMFNGQYAVPVDLNHSAVLDDMDLMKVSNPSECFNKVLTTWHTLNAERQNK